MASKHPVMTVTARTAELIQDGTIPAHGEGRKGAACYTVDGSVYWSYSTAIAVVDHDWRLIVLNVTKYSATTNQRVHFLRYHLQELHPGYTLVTVEPVGFNVTAEQLRRMAHAADDEARMVGAAPEDILGGSDDVTMRRAWVNRYSGRVHHKRNRSTLI